MTPTLMLSCAPAFVARPAATRIAARVVLLAYPFMSPLRYASGGRSGGACPPRLWDAAGTPFRPGAAGLASLASAHAKSISLSISFRFEARDDLARNDLDLLHLVPVRDEN